VYKTSSACLSLAQTCQKICWVNWGWTFDGVRIGLTHAGRVAPSRWAATQRSETAPHGCLVAAFCTFWLCDSDLWPYDLILIGGRGIVLVGEVSWLTIPVPSLEILVSAVLVLSCRQTDRQNHRCGWSLYSRDYRRREWLARPDSLHTVGLTIIIIIVVRFVIVVIGRQTVFGAL